MVPAPLQAGKAVLSPPGRAVKAQAGELRRMLLYHWLKGHGGNEHFQQAERCCSFRRKLVFLNEAEAASGSFLTDTSVSRWPPTKFTQSRHFGWNQCVSTPFFQNVEDIYLRLNLYKPTPRCHCCCSNIKS